MNDNDRKLIKSICFTIAKKKENYKIAFKFNGVIVVGNKICKKLGVIQIKSLDCHNKDGIIKSQKWLMGTLHIKLINRNLVAGAMVRKNTVTIIGPAI